MNSSDKLILVTGATGAQGGAAVHALLDKGFRVRALVRNPDAANAQALAQQGIELAKGDWNDAASLLDAAQGAHGVFSVQRPDVDGSDAERRHGFALVNAAREAGVKHFVHTSVCEAGKHESFPRWDSGYWGKKYWTDKWDIEEAVRGAGFAQWTVLKPAFMMDNYAMPKAQAMFPLLKQGRIVSALKADTRLQLIAADDVGVFAAAAFADPARFHGQNIDMAAQALTQEEVAATLSRELGKTVTAQSVDPAEAIATGMFKGWVRTQEWINEVGYRADIDALKGWGIPMTTFAMWVKRHADEIMVSD